MSRSERSAEPLVFTPAELIALAREDFEIFVELMFPGLHGGERLKHAPYVDYVCAVLIMDGTKVTDNSGNNSRAL